MTSLSMEHISLESQNCEVSSVTSLQLSHRAFFNVSYLSNFLNLERVDLSYNCLTSLEGLSACVNLKWLQVLENKLVTLKGIEGLSKLTVLNAGRNKLETMDEVCALPNLRALILNDNNISSICKLDQMKYLNTLVLSRNPIHVIGNSLKKATSMTKLSLSHCKLQIIGPSLVGCVDLKEARFSHNEIIALPEELAKNIKLRTLDVGNNLIEKVSEIKVLSTLPNLKNLNLLGNPISENDKLVKKVKRLIPNIRIFNSKPLERSNMDLKVYEKGSLHPAKFDSLEIAFGVKDGKNRKKREHKQADAFQRTGLNSFVEETLADESFVRNITDVEPEWKKKMRNFKSDVDVSEKTKISKSNIKIDRSTHNDTLTGNVSVVEGIKKKLKSDTELVEKKIDVKKSSSASMEENIVKNVKKKPERKISVVKLSAKFEDIDDEEVPFVDLIFSGKTIENLEEEKHRETPRDAKHVQHSKKLRKRSENMDSELSALLLFSSKHDIGIGGQSTWDDYSLAKA